MFRTAETEFPILPVIADRWSPRAFDPDREMREGELACLFEAARWAASSSNLQPWHFVHAFRGDRAFATIRDCLNPTNAAWAGRASVLAIAIARTIREDGRPNRHATHDLGQALASLALQATSMGAAVHQMAGFDPERARRDLGVPEGYEPFTAVAIGWPADPATLPEPLRERELASRRRRPVAEFAFRGGWPGAER